MVNRPAVRTTFITPSEIFTEEPKPFSDAHKRRCLRVLRMVAILHGKGFHGLRVFPYIAAIGAYRIELYPAVYSDLDGVKYRFSDDLERQRLIARHSGADEAQFFGWTDAVELTAHALALAFVDRFSELARASYHIDYAYAGWFATLLAHCEYGHLPYLLSEYEEEMDVMRIHHVGEKKTAYQMDWFPLPPTPSGGLSMDPRPSPKWLENQD